MNNINDILMVVILLSVLLSLASNRLVSLVKIMAVQGIMVSLLPLLLEHHSSMGSGGLIFFQVMILIKGVLIPGLLYVALKRIVDPSRDRTDYRLSRVALCRPDHHFIVGIHHR